METSTAQFGWINWSLVFFFLLFSTWLGDRLKSPITNIEGFFKANNSLPWWAVSLSLIATKTSASTFIVVPAFIFAASGNLSYLQATLGFVLGVFVMIFVFLKPYYDEQVYSPYDFIEKRLGIQVGHLTRCIYIVGAVSSQAVRLLVTALVLSVVAGIDTFWCIFIIGGFAVLWSAMGGISTVIWTDVIQYGIFTLGAILAMLAAFNAVSGGLAEVLAIADAKSKLALIDLSTDPKKLSLWAALIGCTFFEFSANAVDQTVTQRTLCCRNLREARRALAFSSIGVLTTWLMGGVALALVAFYEINPLSPVLAREIAQEPDRILPVFIIEQLPVGISGVIIAAIFAAGISTLDSALTALSQVSVVGLARRCSARVSSASQETLVAISRRAIMLWGGLIASLACLADAIEGDSLLVLSFKATGLVYGALVGIAFLSLIRKGRFSSVLIATAASTITVSQLELWQVNFFWWYPVGATVTLMTVILLEYLVKKYNAVN